MSLHPVRRPSGRAGSCAVEGPQRGHSPRTNGTKCSLHTQPLHRYFLRTGPVQEGLFSWSSQAGLRLPGGGWLPAPCCSSLHCEAVAGQCPRLNGHPYASDAPCCVFYLSLSAAQAYHLEGPLDLFASLPYGRV